MIGIRLLFWFSALMALVASVAVVSGRLRGRPVPRFWYGLGVICVTCLVLVIMAAYLISMDMH